VPLLVVVLPELPELVPMPELLVSLPELPELLPMPELLVSLAELPELVLLVSPPALPEPIRLVSLVELVDLVTVVVVVELVELVELMPPVSLPELPLEPPACTAALPSANAVEIMMAKMRLFIVNSSEIVAKTNEKRRKPCGSRDKLTHVAVRRMRTRSPGWQ
jgi:hypothetical protein